MVRQYGRDVSWNPEKQRVCRRHRDYFLSFAEQAAPEFDWPDQVRWFDRSTSSTELRAALTWCEAIPRCRYALRLTAALSRFWFNEVIFDEAVDG